MEIKRDYFLNQLISRKHNGLIKIITGVRRCGKTYLLNKLFYRHLLEAGVAEDHILRFAFDSAEDLSLIGENLIKLETSNKKADPEKFLDYIRAKITGSGMHYLLLDEVQMLGAFEAVLNGYLRKDNIDVFVTGSNAKFLSTDIITEFAGRGDEIHMRPGIGKHVHRQTNSFECSAAFCEFDRVFQQRSVRPAEQSVFISVAFRTFYRRIKIPGQEMKRRPDPGNLLKPYDVSTHIHQLHLKLSSCRTQGGLCSGKESFRTVVNECCAPGDPDALFVCKSGYICGTVRSVIMKVFFHTLIPPALARPPQGRRSPRRQTVSDISAALSHLKRVRSILRRTLYQAAAKRFL